MPYPSVIKFINWITGLPIALEDAMAASFGGFPNRVMVISRTIDFNTVGDTIIPISLPDVYARYFLDSIRINGASGIISTATFGLFSAASGGGTALISSGTAITITTNAENTANNAQINNGPTDRTFNFSTLFFRITNPQGTAKTANVQIVLAPAS